MTPAITVYIISIVFSLVSLLVAAIVSTSIKYEGGANPKDPRRRKMWFWIIGILGSLGNMVFGLTSYYYVTTNPATRAKVITALGIGTGICFLLYIVLGFVLSKIFRNGKLGNWF